MSAPVLTVEGLCKSYPQFRLQDVSFSLAPGKVTGFIGRNGAGKTTTLKSLLNFVHPDKGRVEFFGLDLGQHEAEIKSRLGFVSGGVDFYAQKKLRTISAVTARFYPSWDEAAYRNYMQRFQLSEDKCPRELSAGMKVKYALTLALSHRAELLILDEPTSGLDPVSRDELLDIFLGLSAQGVTILFSTHITSDLEKCADDILYLRAGCLAAQGAREDFLDRWRVLRWTGARPAGKLIGAKEDKTGWSALVERGFQPGENARLEKADLESIMVHMEREAEE